MNIRKVLNFVYTENEKNPEYNFYQCVQYDDFKIYEYLLEMDFENEEYKEFYQHFKNQYQISDRLFKFVIEELAKNGVKEFGKELVINGNTLSKYAKKETVEKSVPKELPKTIPINLPRNVKIVSGQYYIKMMIHNKLYTKYLNLDTPIEEVIKARDEMRLLYTKTKEITPEAKKYVKENRQKQTYDYKNDDRIRRNNKLGEKYICLKKTKIGNEYYYLQICQNSKRVFFKCFSVKSYKLEDVVKFRDQKILELFGES